MTKELVFYFYELFSFVDLWHKLENIENIYNYFMPK